MPGIQFAYTTTGRPPSMVEGLIGKSTSVYLGDAIVQTTNATYSINSVPAMRTLLGLDKTTAHYLETAKAGIFCIAPFGGKTDANGRWSGSAFAGTSYGGISYQFQAMGSEVPNDPNTGQSRFWGYQVGAGTVFQCALDVSSASATPALNNTLAGLILTTTNGVTTFTIDTNAGATDQILRIIKCDESDPLYGSALGRVFFSFLGTYDQYQNGVNYSAR